VSGGSDPAVERTAFVLMPFEKQFDLLFEQILKPALEATGMQVLRADSVVDQQSVMRDVVARGRRARGKLVDLVERWPSVVAELPASCLQVGRLRNATSCPPRRRSSVRSGRRSAA
jgi:hypothetical protein